MLFKFVVFYKWEDYAHERCGCCDSTGKKVLYICVAN
jgi:hypothetical protein